MGQHKNGAYARAREDADEARTQEEARQALIDYLRNIFPAQPEAQIAKVADHQIEWLWRQGYHIVSFVPTEVE